VAGGVAGLNLWSRADPGAPHILIIAFDLLGVAIVWFVLPRLVEMPGDDPSRRIPLRARPLAYLIALTQLVDVVAMLVGWIRMRGAEPENLRLWLATGLAPLIFCLALALLFTVINARPREGHAGLFVAARPLVWSALVLGVYILLISPLMLATS
jgi:hypothetical protein